MPLFPVPKTTPLALERLPRIDYGAHPAYGRAFAPPSLALRLKALARLSPWVAIVAAKRLLLFDRLPPVEDYRGPMGDGLLARVVAGPRYVPIIIRGLAAQLRTVLTGRGRRPASDGEPLASIRRDGIAVGRLTPEEMSQILEQVGIPLEELLRQRSQSGLRTFEGNQRWLNAREAPALYGLLEQILSRHGILEVARGYLGRPVRVTYLTLQVNDPSDAYQHDKFADIGLADSACNYMHVDTSHDMMKCMIYLGEVDEARGPFCYVLGSPRLRVGALEGLLRRAVDRSGLSAYARPIRELFMALPAPLRKKCTFGSDVPDGSREAAALLAAEYRFTTADGNVALFDNHGVHRGAIVRQGERRVLIANLA
jgi:hypothetical protein